MFRSKIEYRDRQYLRNDNYASSDCKQQDGRNPVKKSLIVGKTQEPSNNRLFVGSNGKTTTTGFEPARGDPNAFRMRLLNHLDTLSIDVG